MEKRTTIPEGPQGPQSYGEWVDTTAGANAIRLWLGVVALIIYLWPPAHRTQAWNFCKLIAALNAPILFIWIFFPPIQLIYQLLFWLLNLILTAVDAVSFRLPRWLLRKRLGSGSAFWLAVALQAVLIAAGGLSAERAMAARAQLQRPARFGPAVMRRLHVDGLGPFMYREMNGRILPLISPQESLRLHR